MLSGPNAELIKQLWQQQSGYEKPKLRSMVWRSYRGIQAEIHRQILPAEVWSAVLVCRKSRLLFMCGPWTRCSTWCNSQECEHHVYQHQSDAGNMGNNCQNPSSAQHNLNCRWVLHETNQWGFTSVQLNLVKAIMCVAYFLLYPRVIKALQYHGHI